MYYIQGMSSLIQAAQTLPLISDGMIFIDRFTKRRRDQAHHDALH